VVDGRSGKQREGIVNELVNAACINVNSILGRLDPEIPILDLGGQIGDLLCTVGKWLAIMQLQQRAAITLRQAIVLARSKHNTTRRIVLLECAARMRAYLHHENVTDSEFEANA